MATRLVEKYPDPWPERNWAVLHERDGEPIRELGIWFRTEDEAVTFIEGAFQRTVAGAARDENSVPQRVPGGYRAGHHTFTVAPLPRMVANGYEFWR